MVHKTGIQAYQRVTGASKAATYIYRVPTPRGEENVILQIAECKYYPVTSAGEGIDINLDPFSPDVESVASGTAEYMHIALLTIGGEEIDEWRVSEGHTGEAYDGPYMVATIHGEYTRYPIPDDTMDAMAKDGNGNITPDGYKQA